MKKAAIVPLVLMVLALQGLAYAGAPRQIAGIRLGAPIEQYRDLVREDTRITVRHMKYISEVQMKPIDGYKSGYIYYGNCTSPGTIFKIKLKYLRDDKEFFNDLLELFKGKFGKASEYRGDAFGGYIAWKWSFTDEHKNKISLILQHNSVDEEEYTSGNSVKLAITTAMEKERECYEAKYPGTGRGAGAAQKDSSREIKDLKIFLPE